MIVNMEVNALQFGKIKLNSAQNSPLDAVISVNLSKQDNIDQLKASIAPKENYDAQGIERSEIHNNIQLTLTPTNGNQAVLALSSKIAVSDPFLDLLIQIESPEGKVFKEYTVLLDPPEKDVISKNIQDKSVVTKRVEQKKGSEKKLVNIKKTESESESSKKDQRKEVIAQPGKTLFQIARENSIAGISTEQIVVAMYKLNPGAFDKNINGLIKGRKLQLPSRDYYESLSHLQARSILKQENIAWKNITTNNNSKNKTNKTNVKKTESEELARLKSELMEANRKLQQKESALNDMKNNQITPKQVDALEIKSPELTSKIDGQVIPGIEEKVIDDEPNKPFISSVTNQDENIIQEVIVDDKGSESMRPVFVLLLLLLFTLLIGLLFALRRKKRSINQSPISTFSANQQSYGVLSTEDPISRLDINNEDLTYTPINSNEANENDLSGHEDLDSQKNKDDLARP